MNLLDFIDNSRLFNQQFLDFGLPTSFKEAEATPVFEQIKQIFVGKDLAVFSEPQLEEEVIKGVLQALGYTYIYQVGKQFQGKNVRFDFALFADNSTKDTHYNLDKASNEGILALCESKAYSEVLDNKKMDTQNPHFQLIQYLTYFRVGYGFLTNGKYWRFYDVKEATADKVYFQIDLEKIVKEDSLEAFYYFFYIFRKETLAQLALPAPKTPYLKDEEIPTLNLFQQNTEFISRTIGDLKGFIYGEKGQSSVIEHIGQTLYNHHHETHSLQEIYNDSVFFAFRLLFIAYMESKFKQTMFEEHEFYRLYSLRTLLEKLETAEGYYLPDGFMGWKELIDLFILLDKGRQEVQIPLFNGGLFAPEKTPLLDTPCLLDNDTLRNFLRILLHHNENSLGTTPKTYHLFTVWRDFSSLSVHHIGHIYEGLLEFEFKKEYGTSHYVVYEQNKKIVEQRLDLEAYLELKKSNPKLKFVQDIEYKTNDIYLINQSNTRKATASFYTPESVTDFMIQESLEVAIKKHQSILDIRVLDNACGSGHFLIACLKTLTKLGLENMLEGKDAKLAQVIALEAHNVNASLKRYLPTITEKVDEFALLKRILLKKILFGVDLNGFAIEVTRLSLWIDTFIIGTPLSFIEHHIKQGNALVGSTKQELLDSVKQDNLFESALKDKIKELVSKLIILSDLKDTTAAEIAESKRIYTQVTPILQQLNLAMHFFTYQKFLKIAIDQKFPFLGIDPNDSTVDGDNLQKLKTKLNQTVGILESNKFEKDIFEHQDKILVGEIEHLAHEYHFFNYEIEFAEAFQNGHQGFDIIIGNPPWDKTKFDDKDFFPFFRSDYRMMKQSEKTKLRQEVFGYKGVRQEYEAKEQRIQYINEYYKIHYPYNAGVGDNNLFRFFIERNLSLLSKVGTLTYVTPSAWIYEDSSTNLRKHILEKYKLHFFYQIENKGIFPDVHRNYKFAIFKISQSPITSKGGVQTDSPLGLEASIPVRFMLQNTKVLYTPEVHSGAIPYPIASIKELSPDKWSLFEIKSRKDLELITRFYDHFKVLSPDYLDFRRELDMTNDKSLFQEQKSDMLLYEGKMIHQFNYDFAPAQYWVGKIEFEAYMQSLELNRLVGDVFEALPATAKDMKTHKNKLTAILHYFNTIYSKNWTEADLLQRIVFDKKYPRLAFRGIARNTDARTLISAILPAEHTFGHSMFAHIPKKYVMENNDITVQSVPLERVLFVNAIFNSLVLDYVIRFLVDINVVKSIVMRLPIPQPTDAELVSNSDYLRIVELTYKLNTANASDTYLTFENGQEKIWSKDLPTTDKEKRAMQIELDCFIARLYSVSIQELAHITSVDYFKILNENDFYVPLLLDRYETGF
jgi:hypothetical protein